MTSYMYNPSKKVTEILSKFLEFDPEQLQLGIWSGDLVLTNVNLRADALYSKINRMKKSPSGRDPLKLKIVESTISQLRIQIPWKRLLWGQGDVVIDIKGVNVVLGFESREESDARQAAEESQEKSKEKKDDNNTNETVKCSKKFRQAKQKVLAAAEERLMQGQHLSTWLAHIIKKELTADKDCVQVGGEKKAKGFDKWLSKASSNLVWRFLSGLRVNIEGFKLVIVQDNIEVGVILTNAHMQSGKIRATQTPLTDEHDDVKSFDRAPKPGEVEDGDNIDKSVDAIGVSVFVRRQFMFQNEAMHPQSALLPDDYVVRPIDINCSLSVFYPHEDQSRKRKTVAGVTTGLHDGVSMAESTSSSKRRRGKRDKLRRRHGSQDGTAETDIGSSFAPDSAVKLQTQHGFISQTFEKSTDEKGSMYSLRRSRSNVIKYRPAAIARGHAMPPFQTRPSSGSRASPLVRPDDLSSVYASAMAESTQLTPKFDMTMNCGEIKVVCSSRHLDIINSFFAVGSRMRNGRPTGAISDVLAKGERGVGKRNAFNSPQTGGASVDELMPQFGRRKTEGSIGVSRLRSEFPSRRISMGMRNELAAKSRNRRSQVIRSWWHYAYGVVAYEIQKRKRRRDNFKEKYVSFDWERQKKSREEYVNLYLDMELDVGQHIATDGSVMDPGAEDLLRIEDELPIEQILLYRSVARALATHGLRAMPASVELLYKDYASDWVEHRAAPVPSAGDVSMHIDKRPSMKHYTQQHGATDEVDDENLVSVLGRKCKSSRLHRSYMVGDDIQLFGEEPSHLAARADKSQDDHEMRSKGNLRASRMEPGAASVDSGDAARDVAAEDLGLEKASFSYDYSEEMQEELPKAPSSGHRPRRADGADGRTVRTMKTTKTRSTMAGTILENMNQHDATSTGAKMSFAFFFKSAELMLVSDEGNMATSRRPSTNNFSQDDSRSGSSDDVSELSFLSEEDFFREQESAPAAPVEEEVDDSPMLSSTDFLLFGLPKNLLLHVTMSPLRCAILGRSGGSKNINFTIGSVTASGDGRANLIAIGSRASPTPVPVVSLTKRDRNPSRDAGVRFSGHPAGPKEALTFSFVLSKAQKVLQADVSKVHVCLDVPLLVRLMKFPLTSDVGHPRRTLPKSEREEARLFILRENPPSQLAGINSSIRIHGFDVSIPVDALELPIDTASSGSSHSGSFERPESHSPSARITAGIVELYSGSAVQDLCNTEKGGQVGSLGMLDVDGLMSSRGNLASQHCVSIFFTMYITPTLTGKLTPSCQFSKKVVAVSGVECALRTDTDAFAFSEAPSLLAEPVDVELLFTNSCSTILDEDNPKQEIMLEVSPIHILLSETRLLFCNRVLQPLTVRSTDHSPGEEVSSTPPRLEALSRLIMKCVDVSIRGLKLSLMSDEQKYPLTPGQKEIIMEECIGDFLSIVSCFDQNYPNEDALSSSMQVCIDRLCGLGLHAEDAWDCANSALISYLGDEAHVQSTSSQQSMDESTKSAASDMSESESVKDPPSQEESPVDRAIRNAVSKAVYEFPPPDDEIDPQRQPLNTLLVVDLPGGLQVSTIQLFYDFHVAASLPTLFVTNAAGLRLLRIAPIENNEPVADLGSSAGDFDSGSEHGLSFSRFLLDEEYCFGKGGLPLSILGSDETTDDGDSFVRSRERLDDLQIGELEVFFSHRTFDALTKVISKMKGCLSSSDVNQGDVDGKTTQADTPIKSSLFAKFDVLSVLLASDELVPFSRIRCDCLYIKKEGRPLDTEQPYIPVMRIVSRTFALLNLTEAGQYYPDAISLLYAEETTSFPFQVEYISNSPPWQLGSKLKVSLRGFRLFLLRQYINELLQFFLSELYGVGKLRHAAKKQDEMNKAGAQDKDTTPPLSYTIYVLNSSLILPRRSDSHDLACIELGRGLIFNSRHMHSFMMPTDSSPFYAEHSDAPSPGNIFTRMNFQLHQMRLFTSLSEDKPTHDQNESRIFRCFYDINGRAEDAGWVYTKQSLLSEDPPEEHAAGFDSLCNRRWKEITTGILSLDVLVDYAPNLRVVICEPLEPQHFVPAPRLDVRLSQFCMLVSVWYSNMQEVPLLFPYPPSKFKNDCRTLLWKTQPAEYGTAEYLDVWNNWSCVKTEICVILRNLGMRCQFDRKGYFDHDIEIQPFYTNPEGEAHCVQIVFTDVVVHTYSDFRGMMRVACAASGFDLIDERRNSNCQRTFEISKRNPKAADDTTFTTWGDLRWGLREDAKCLDKSLPQPFQLSVFMTKDWCLINLGLEEANGILSELSPIWFFLGFFVSYWSDKAYGNPNFIGQAAARNVKNALQSSRGLHLMDPDGLNMDFRLLLTKPHLCLPCDLIDPRGPSLRIESETGLWYRFRKIKEYKMQEVISTGLDLVFANEFLAPRESFDSRDTMVRHLVEGLSFALRLDGNNTYTGHYHADYALEIPYNPSSKADCSIRSHEIHVQPSILEAQTICSPVEIPTRLLGPVVCEITCILEVLPLTSSVMVNFFSGPVDDTMAQAEPVEEKKTFSFSGNIGGLRLFAVDPVLGVQLPVAVISVSSIALTASQLSQDPTKRTQISRGESPPEDLQVTVDFHIWGDYFKLGVTRSWEPLLEPYRCLLLYEKSKYRGTGMSLNSDCPLHVNVSGALLLIVDEVVDSFSRLIKEVFGQDMEQELERVVPKSSLLRERLTVGEKVRLTGGQNIMVVHAIPKPLLGDRVAFSFNNLTGQKIRIHQQEGLFRHDERMKPAIVTYLNHNESTSLSFDATISVTKNLSVVEVPYPGLSNSRSMMRAERSTKHAVDLQLPGFSWVQGVKVDTFGRKFEALRPRSTGLLSKMMQDWRLENALQLLVEVGLDNGGRLVTVRSLFEVRNNTTHALSVLLHPDPQHKPNNTKRLMDESSLEQHDDSGPASDAISMVQPGDFYQIPTFLLESSLQMGGSHLGSLWLKPDPHDEISFRSLVPGIGRESSGETNLETNYCSRPVQLAKLVQESSVIFDDHGDTEISPEKAKTGIQLACVVKSKSGESLAPFCYAIEIGRSPIVPDKKKAPAGGYVGGSQRIEHIDTHGPVTYTLSIHAPLVITNLLPETGRFELMHAVRRTVLWFGDLKPGEQMPVHSVGLDAPLLLLLNLGFCRTPVGEGALVHHGADVQAGSKGNSMCA
jgi:N-terminal region of Chorein or VPS13